MRVRDFAALLARIGNSGRKLAVLVKEPAAIEAAGKLFAVQELLTERNKYMEQIRTNYNEFVCCGLTSKDRKFTMQAPEHIIVEIVTLCDLKLIDDMLSIDTKLAVGALLSTLCWVKPTDDNMSHFGFSFTSGISACDAAQISLVLACGEKLLKSDRREKVIGIAKEINKKFAIDIDYLSTATGKNLHYILEIYGTYMERYCIRYKYRQCSTAFYSIL